MKMEFEKINGMEAARYIAANLLNDSNYNGDKYYKKEEDELTDKIKKYLDTLELTEVCKLSLFYKIEDEFRMQDINDRLEELDKSATEEEKRAILELYKDWQSEDEQWRYNLDEAVNTILNE